MTTRLVGTCPVCERHQKVTPGGGMVHHGFKRPGWGAIGTSEEVLDVIARMAPP